jgi:predicted CXXCH cytochrome family protein
MRLGGSIALSIAVTVLAGTSEGAEPAPTFVGSSACSPCHAEQYQAWHASQHQAAMQDMSDKAALGNFAGARFTYGGITSTFFRRDGGYYVRTDGPDGKLAEFRVRYTFGVVPLQQYLVEMPDGRLQALPIAWDVAGKRWIHLYPKERVDHNDELHWTRSSQNWNGMCADCHSTGLRKNYDAASGRFRTSWSEISVGCEACHGPGSQHVAWANAGRGRYLDGDATKGLSAMLDERRGVVWARDAASATAARSQPRKYEREIEVCAQCHSRRGQIADGYAAGKPFLDYYRPALLTAALYHPDGQQRDEVYDWGSFLQSRMYAAGVTCSDCHEPHSGKLRAQGNAVCSQCHSPAQFDSSLHHHHPAGSAGAQCANCHMPTATYMVIDPRHDHSLRVPRPDLSAQLATPNACNACHAKRDSGWAAAQVRSWFGRDPQGYQRFAVAFGRSNADAIGAAKELRAIASDAAEPQIARATALSRLDANASSATLDIVVAGLRDANPLIRMGALDSLSAAPTELRTRYAVPLLSDPLRTIRIGAASALADVPLGSASQEQRAAFERAAKEYVDSQRYNADRADARVNLGLFEARRGNPALAEEELKSAITLDPLFVPAYVNLADLYRASGREDDAARVLRLGLGRVPRSAALHHALGLALVRAKQSALALQELAQATKLEPSNARFAYVYGVALYSAGLADEAIAALITASAKHPADTNILEALRSFYRDRGNDVEARRYDEQLRAARAGS